MKEVKVSYITEKEENEVRTEYNREVAKGVKPEQTLDELLKVIRNQTLVVMRQVKNAVEWKDIEKMVKFVRVLENCDKAKGATFKLEDDEHKVAIEVFKDAVATGKISGYGLEKFVGVYADLEAAK